MAYNKTEHLRRNIEAIRRAFALEREQRAATLEERDVLRAYSGFGAIKEVLEPLPHKKKTALTPLIEELHAVLKENTDGEREYKRYLDGIKASVLTAFYTPEPVTDAIMRMLYNAGVVPVRALEPSAGTGAFVEYLRRYNEGAEITCFEKDPMTGLILSRLYPDDTVRVQGLETIEPAYEGHFDLITSNIPFGDVSLFDPAFSNSRDPVRRQSAWAIHNYFFMKSVDLVRDGGLVAFITSQGMADSERNKPVREWLMERCDLVAAVRLPNNFFTDHAGTEEGSDLIVLQKNSGGPPPLRAAAGLYRNTHALERHYGKQQLPIARPRGADLGQSGHEPLRETGDGVHPCRRRGRHRPYAGGYARGGYGAAFQPGAVRKPCPEDRSASVQGTADGDGKSATGARRHRTGTEYGAVRANGIAATREPRDRTGNSCDGA